MVTCCGPCLYCHAGRNGIWGRTTSQSSLTTNQHYGMASLVYFKYGGTDGRAPDRYQNLRRPDNDGGLDRFIDWKGGVHRRGIGRLRQRRADHGGGVIRGRRRNRG